MSITQNRSIRLSTSVTSDWTNIRRTAV